jgi:hypothetical protein
VCVCVRVWRHSHSNTPPPAGKSVYAPSRVHASLPHLCVLVDDKARVFEARRMHAHVLAAVFVTEENWRNALSVVQNAAREADADTTSVNGLQSGSTPNASTAPSAPGDGVLAARRRRIAAAARAPVQVLAFSDERDLTGYISAQLATGTPDVAERAREHVTRRSRMRLTTSHAHAEAVARVSRLASEAQRRTYVASGVSFADVLAHGGPHHSHPHPTPRHAAVAEVFAFLTQQDVEEPNEV